MKCSQCQCELHLEISICHHCGGRIDEQERESLLQAGDEAVDSEENSSSGLRLRQILTLPLEIFSNVFKKHTEEDAERLFLVGTSHTTPPLEKILDSWPRPWLFARIFLMIAFLYLGLWIGFEIFNNANFFPGLIMVGSFIAPITTLIFFWEMNAPQNISIYKIINILFIGGMLSLVMAVFFFENIGDESVIMIGIVEEVAKLLVVIWFLRNHHYRYILNGVLVGAAVGTGFAAFESAGYALMSVLLRDFETMYMTIFWRGVLAPGGHIVWAALAGGALCLVKGTRRLHFSMLTDMRFLLLFAIVVISHAMWDLSWPTIWGIPVVQICLMIASWFITFFVLFLGLKEISEIKRVRQEKYTKENSGVSMGANE
jgi:protease PrsW